MQRIFIFSREAMFGQGVASLLGHCADITIIGREHDPDRALQCVRDLRPDVVVVDMTDIAGDPHAFVMQVLEAGIVDKVIGLGLGDNTIRIYREEQRVAREVADLIQAVQSDASSQ